MLFQPAHAARPDLLHEPVDDLDAGEIALVHRAVEALPGEGLLVKRAVGVAIEEAADLVLELGDALDGTLAQTPGQILARQPLAADDGVHEMPLEGIAGRDGHVVAALNHPRAAALAHQSLDGDGDPQIGTRLLGVQSGEQAGAARAENQDIGSERVHAHLRSHRQRTAARPQERDRRPSLSSACAGRAREGARAPARAARTSGARRAAPPAPTPTP